jgi:hypothetical protein
MMYYHSWSKILTLCHYSSYFVNFCYFMCVPCLSGFLFKCSNALFAYSPAVTLCHEWPHLALFLMLNTPVVIQSHVFTLSHPCSCHVVVFSFFTILRIVTLCHALSRVMLSGRRWSLVVAAFVLEHCVRVGYVRLS